MRGTRNIPCLLYTSAAVSIADSCRALLQRGKLPSGLPGEGHPVPPVVRVADGVVGDGGAVEGGQEVLPSGRGIAVGVQGRAVFGPGGDVAACVVAVDVHVPVRPRLFRQLIQGVVFVEERAAHAVRQARDVPVPVVAYGPAPTVHRHLAHQRRRFAGSAGEIFEKGLHGPHVTHTVPDLGQRYPN